MISSSLTIHNKKEIDWESKTFNLQFVRMVRCEDDLWSIIWRFSFKKKLYFPHKLPLFTTQFSRVFKPLVGGPSAPAAPAPLRGLPSGASATASRLTAHVAPPPGMHRPGCRRQSSQAWAYAGDLKRTGWGCFPASCGAAQPCPPQHGRRRCRVDIRRCRHRLSPLGAQGHPPSRLWLLQSYSEECLGVVRQCFKVMNKQYSFLGNSG